MHVPDDEILKLGAHVKRGFASDHDAVVMITFAPWQVMAGCFLACDNV